MRRLKTSPFLSRGQERKKRKEAASKMMTINFAPHKRVPYHGEQSGMVNAGKSTLNVRATQRVNKIPRSTKKKSKVRWKL